MDYKDIEEANKKLKTIDVKGKNYIEVNERIKAFRMLYPDGFIDTQMLSNENGVCIFKAQVGYYGEDNCINWLGVGHAYEKEGSTFINKTSYIENCETSAVGRALGMAGFGIDTSVASAEEVQNAIIQQEGEKIINKTQAEALKIAIENNMLDISGLDKEILKQYGYNEVEEIKIKDYGKIVNEFKKVKGE